MTTTQLKKTVVATLLLGGIALAGLGLTARVAQAQPDGPGVTIDHSDFGVDVVECTRCGLNLPGKVDIGAGVNPAIKVPVAVVQGAR